MKITSIEVNQTGLINWWKNVSTKWWSIQTGIMTMHKNDNDQLRFWDKMITITADTIS